MSVCQCASLKGSTESCGLVVYPWIQCIAIMATAVPTEPVILDTIVYPRSLGLHLDEIFHLLIYDSFGKESQSLV